MKGQYKIEVAGQVFRMSSERQAIAACRFEPAGAVVIAPDGTRTYYGHQAPSVVYYQGDNFEGQT